MPEITHGAAIPFVYDDGGRADAGFKGRAADCVCRALAIATETPYGEVYQSLNALSSRERGRQSRTGRTRRSSARNGVYRPTRQRYLATIGWIWHATMTIGSGCRVHLRADELPPYGRIIVKLSGHMAAVVDGVLHDTYDCSRGGQRCVYGFWHSPEQGCLRCVSSEE